MSPEGDDGHLSVQSLLVFREVDGEESTDRLSRQLSRCLTENAAEHRGEELNLKGRKDQKCDNRPHLKPSADQEKQKCESPDGRRPESADPLETCRIRSHLH